MSFALAFLIIERLGYLERCIDDDAADCYCCEHLANC